MAFVLEDLVEIRKHAKGWTIKHFDTEARVVKATYEITPGVWDESSKMALRGLWQDDRMSASKIAEVLGFFTAEGAPGKNAIVVKAGRLKLEPRPSPILSGPAHIKAKPISPGQSTLPPLSSDFLPSVPSPAPRLQAAITKPPVISHPQPKPMPAAPEPNGAHVQAETGEAVKLPVPPMKNMTDPIFDKDYGICTRTEPAPVGRSWLRCTGEVVNRTSYCASCQSKEQLYTNKPRDRREMNGAALKGRQRTLDDLSR